MAIYFSYIIYYKHVLKWYKTLSKFKPKIYAWDIICNVLRIYYKSDLNVIYLSIVLTSFIGPLKLFLAALIAFFFKAVLEVKAV